jgi:cysteine desulfurase/selenocysteine lyase
VLIRPGDVVASVMEHHSNIVPWQILAEERGFTIRYIPITDGGELDLDAYAALLRENPVRLVSVMHVSNVLGTVNPIREMAIRPTPPERCSWRTARRRPASEGRCPGA